MKEQHVVDMEVVGCNRIMTFVFVDVDITPSSSRDRNVAGTHVPYA